MVGFIERKIDTNPLMRLSPRRESPGTDMGQHLKSARQGITKMGGGGGGGVGVGGGGGGAMPA